MATWKIEQAELIEWLRAYDGPRFHSVVCDPPYALISIGKRFGKEGSAPAQEGADGRFSRLSKGFMGAKWDSFESFDQYREWVGSWAKLLIEKALEPGAVCMFFGGSRTSHHLALGLEQGGFEVYDTLMWLTGQGFPKGHSQSAGIWREVLQCQLNASAPLVVQVSKSVHLTSSMGGESTVLAPAILLPEGDPVLIIQDGKAEDTHVEAISLSILDLELAEPNMMSLWRKQLDVSFNQANASIIEMELSPTIVSKILSCYRSVSTTKNTANLANGQPWCACTVTKNLLGSNPKQSVVPFLSVLGHAGWNPVLTWIGRNVALKPAYEPIILCRAPRGNLTYAQLAVEHQSGALNIDGSRIGHNEPEEVMEPHEPQFGKTTYANAQPSQDREGQALASPNPSGRWPANLILSHHEDCHKIGEAEVPSYVINRWKEGMKPFGEGAGGEYETIHPSRAGEPSADRTYESEGGTDFAMKPGERREPNMELVERWACVPECPVRQLDDQVGDLGNSLRQNRTVGQQTLSGMAMFGERILGETYEGVSGGPSRFFYTGKATRGEKDLGLDDFYWKRVDTGFERITRAEWQKLPKSERARGCIHPTIKPTAIIRYLATLVLPPKQDGIIRRMLIPFSGSGSEIIGAIQAGWDEVTGIEMESNYNDMAHARLRAAIGMF